MVLTGNGKKVIVSPSMLPLIKKASAPVPVAAPEQPELVSVEVDSKKYVCL